LAHLELRVSYGQRLLGCSINVHYECNVSDLKSEITSVCKIYSED
jgi:hypothetical protein